MSFGFTLQKASHLIGEIGDVRSYDEKSGRYEVHFEDESYKPCRVKHANLRIIFELPDDNITGEDEEDYEDEADYTHLLSSDPAVEVENISKEDKVDI